MSTLFHTDQRGISPTSVLVFVVFALSIVVANGIIMNVNKQRRAVLAQSKIGGFEIATSLCGKTYNPSAPECTIVTATSCGDYFVLQSDCGDTQPVLLSPSGEILGMCGGEQLSLDRCEKYLKPYSLMTCLVQENLCAL